MARKKRGTQEINAGSMADIAFLLLIFFLVTTTMDTDTGVARRLPPPSEDVEPPEFKQRNVFVVLVNSQDKLLVEDKPMNINQLKEEAKEFIENPNNKKNLPEKQKITVQKCKKEMSRLKQAMKKEEDSKEKQKLKRKVKKWEKRLKAAKELGGFKLTKQVISLQNDRGTSYDMYIKVQNELAAAYNELRNDLAQKKYGKKYKDLPEDKADVIKSVYPQKISEAEPKDVGGE